MSDKSIVEQIKHYQRDIVKCPDNSKRMLRCIERLTVLPVTIAHLQDTGVGRSVNELRKCGGEVGAAANALVCKWKSMVKDEEESEQESEVEEMEKRKSASVDHRSSSSHRSDSPHNHKEVHNREDHRKSISSHSSPKKPDHTHSDKSPKKEDRNSSHKSDHRSSRDKSSSKSGYSSSSDSKYNSHRSKTEHDLKSLKKTSSSHGSESECNGNMKSDKSHSNSKYESKSRKSNSTSESKTKDSKQKYDKEKSRKEEISYKSSSQSSIKKYDIRKIDSESSDDDSVYKPKSCSVKRKKSLSEEEDKYENKRSRKPTEKESVKKRKYESSEESNEGSESDGEADHDYEGVSESKTNSESEEEVINRHTATENKISGEESESDDNRSASPESDDHKGSLHSGRDDDSEEQSDSSEKDIYVPVNIKKEKESPPRNSKSHSREKGKSINVKSSHSSSSHSQKYKTSDNLAKKKDDKYDDVKIKKEKVDKDKINAQRHKERRSSIDKKSKSSSSHLESSNKQTTKPDKKVKVKIEKAEDGSIGCESGASFGDALLGLADTKKKSLKKKSTTPNQVKSPNPTEKSYTMKSKSLIKSEPRTSSSSSSSKPYNEPDLLSKNVKLEPLDVDLKATLPEITPNYKPLPHYSPPDSPAYKSQKLCSQEDALSSIMYNKNQRTKVYSGNKSGYTKVPSLFELCTQVLRDNIEALEYTGGVPYDLLKPVLDRATADQLFQLEHYNPYLVEDTDGLWQFHCNKDFRGKKPEEFETWRELYLRLLDEREKKLEALKANISQSMAKSTPIRQTKLAYVDSVVKPPRNIARKQMKFGTGKAVKHELVSRAMVGSAGSSPAAEPAVPVPAPSRPNSSSAAFPIPNFLKKKKAPLMAKALQLIKGNRFKR